MIFALNRSMRAAAMLVPILLADSPVCAQDPASGETSAVIEEIVVIARYRSENLGDVPDSITAFTAADIDAHRIERVNRVASLTPNLRFSDDQEVGVSTLIIRGVRQNRGTGQPPVSFRVDGVSAKPVDDPGPVRHREHRGSARAAGGALRA
jgi:iron complex outermembrane receptor protein